MAIPIISKKTVVNWVSNRYWSDDEGNWYYSDKDGRLLIGAQTVDFINVYFYDDGVQVKGDFAPNGHY